MKTASVREVRHDFNRILDWVAQGEQVEITRRKRVVARLVAANPKRRKPEWPDFEARRKKLFPKEIKGKPVSQIVDEARGAY